MRKTKIEWTDSTWNPTTGCTKISSGCKNCYAERMSKRLQLMGTPKYRNGFDLAIHQKVLKEPYNWKSPRTVFVNSMSDLFHENMPLDFIRAVFKTMNENPRHTFQVLTKRADILLEYNSYLNWSKNIWMGVSVEEQKYVERVDKLRITNANVKFLSLEPLISSIECIDLENIDWVIVGGESGPNSRPIYEEWVLQLKDICIEQSVPFFFKQWGGTNKKKSGRLLEGEVWNEMPLLYDQINN